LEPAFLEDVIARLDRLGLAYAVTGSIASNLWGTPRLTHDVDIVVVLPESEVPRVVAAFSDDYYYVSEPAARDAVRRGGMFNIVDTGRNVKADMWITKDDAFNQSTLARRRRVEILPGREAYVATAEDVLLHKLVWHQITPSDRQLGDAAGIAAVQAGDLDLSYMRGWAAQQGTTALLDEVLAGKYLKAT
jgi:hypothetical protein